MNIDNKKGFTLAIPFDMREHGPYVEILVPVVIEAILLKDDTVLFDTMNSWELDEREYSATCETITGMYQGVKDSIPVYIQELSNHYIEEVEELCDTTIIKYLPYEE